MTYILKLILRIGRSALDLRAFQTNSSLALTGRCRNQTADNYKLTYFGQGPVTPSFVLFEI